MNFTKEEKEIILKALKYMEDLYEFRVGDSDEEVVELIEKIKYE